VRGRALALAALAALPAAARAQPAEPPTPPTPAEPSREAAPIEVSAGVGTVEVEAAAPASGEAAPAEVAAPGGEAAPPEPVEVTVIGTRADALQRVPGSGTLITRKEIERAQPRDVGEMLRRVPGITARQERDAGNRIDIGVRGMDAPRGRRVLLLEDGIPLPINPYGEPDLYHGPPVERMRAIEVVKGSGSTLFGPQTVGAVINFLTIAPPSAREARLELEGGFPAYGKVLGRFGDVAGDGAVRYVGQIFHERGEGAREQPFHATDMLAKVAFMTGQTGEATLKVSLHEEAASSTQAGMTREMFVEDPYRPTLAPHDRLHVRKYDVALTHELPFDESTTLRTLVFAYTTSRIWRNQQYERSMTTVAGTRYERIVGDPRLPNGALYFKNATTIPDRSYDVAGVEPRLEHRFPTAGLRHTLVAGARFLGERGERQQRTGETPTSYAGSVDSDEASSTWAVAAYAQDKIAAAESLIVTPGLRFEHARFRRQIRRAYVDGAPRDVNIIGESEMTEVIPGVGAIAGSKENHAFGGFHVGFAPPRLATAISDEGIDAQLDAERSLSWEAGARLRPLRWARLEATGFLSSYGNQVIPSTGAGRKAELKNAGQTRHAGVEGATALRLGEALGWETALDIGVRYTFSHASFRYGPRAGNLLPYAPLHTGAATLDVEHPAGAGGQVAVSYVGDQFTDEENTIAEDTSGRYGIMAARAILDVGARYRHAATGLTASVSVKNALDQPYVTSRRPDGIFPSGFRQITLGLRWDYAAAAEP